MKRKKHRGGKRGNVSVRVNRRLAKQAAATAWMAKVRAWASSFPQRNYVVDDSRESIYGEA